MVIDAQGENLGVMSLDAALQIAADAGLDLVEVGSKSKPPTCKLLDYGKFKFQLVKQKSDFKKKQKSVQLKEIKIRPNTDVGDYEVKLRNLRRFLGDGARVKVTLRFKGREAKFRELGENMLARVKNDVIDIAVAEIDPKIEGRQLSLICTPKSKK